MKDVIRLNTMDEIKAFSDPFRYKILMCFYRKKQPATVKEIAVAMNMVPANIHYHVKKLEKVGILELVYTKEINNIIAKYYQPTAETFEINYDDELAKSSRQLVLAESKQIIQQIYDDSKDVFLENMGDSIKKTKGTLSMDGLYLTDEEAIEFREYIQTFVTAHNTEDRQVENLRNFHCFFSIIEMVK